MYRFRPEGKIHCTSLFQFKFIISRYRIFRMPLKSITLDKKTNGHTHGIHFHNTSGHFIIPQVPVNGYVRIEQFNVLGQYKSHNRIMRRSAAFNCKGAEVPDKSISFTEDS